MAGGGEDGVGGVAVGAFEEVPAHASIGLGVGGCRAGSTADRRRRSRLITSVTPRFWPEM